MEKSLTKYMVIDLTILSVIGFILEIFCVRFSAVVFNSPPAMVISLLIVFIAVARWNLWGLVITPVLALGVFLGGNWIEYASLKAIYDWRYCLASMIGLLTTGVNVIWYKIFGTKKVINGYALPCVVFLNFLLFALVHWLSYDIITLGTSAYSISTFWSSLFGCFVLLVGSYVLRSQGILCNMKQKFIDDKKEFELMEKDKNFRIKENPEEEPSADGDSKEQE